MKKINIALVSVLVLFIVVCAVTYNKESSKVRFENHQFGTWIFEDPIPVCLMEGLCYIHITPDGVWEVTLQTNQRTASTVKLTPSAFDKLTPFGRVIYRTDDLTLTVVDLPNRLMFKGESYRWSYKDKP